MLKIKDTYIFVKNIKTIKYLRDFRGSDNGGSLQITYFDNSVIDVSVNNREEYQEFAKKIVEKVEE